MRRRDVLFIVAVAGSAAFTSGCGVWQQARFKRDVEVTFLIPAGVKLAAETENGAIKLTEAPRDDVWVRAHIRATTQERADAVQITGDTSAADTLRILAAWPTPRTGSEGVSFEIASPGGRPVRATTSNGGIEVSGFAGGLEARTSNGAVMISGHDGAVRCGTSNGGVTILGAAGPLDISTSNGSIRAELDGGGPFHVDTSNGSVSIVVGPGFSGEIGASTSNGVVSATDESGAARVQTSGDRTSKRVVIGGGGQDSTVSTSNGSVTITVRK